MGRNVFGSLPGQSAFGGSEKTPRITNFNIGAGEKPYSPTKNPYSIPGANIGALPGGQGGQAPGINGPPGLNPYSPGGGSSASPGGPPPIGVPPGGGPGRPGAGPGLGTLPFPTIGYNPGYAPPVIPGGGQGGTPEQGGFNPGPYTPPIGNPGPSANQNRFAPRPGAPPTPTPYHLLRFLQRAFPLKGGPGQVQTNTAPGDFGNINSGNLAGAQYFNPFTG